MKKLFLPTLIIALAGSPATAPAETIFAIDVSNRLLSFDSATPNTVNFINGGAPISGLQAGEQLLGIDFRPVATNSPFAVMNGTLYGVGATDRLYTIDIATGAARVIGTAANFALNGSALGVDFNPLPDLLRIVSELEENIRVNPSTGAVEGTDNPLAYVAGDSGFGINPTVVGAAYTNNFGGATQTTLFGIDSGRDVLVRQGGLNGPPSPNGGQLTTIGSGLSLNTTDEVGFDISGLTGTAYASLSTVIGPLDPSSALHVINLSTGTSTLVGSIGPGGGPGAFVTRDIAAPVGIPVPEPGVAGLLLLGFAAFSGQRFRRP